MVLMKDAASGFKVYKDDLLNKTNELFNRFNENSVRSRLALSNSMPIDTIFTDNFEQIKNIKYYLKKNVIYQSSYPEFLTNSVRRLLMYRKQIIHLTNILSNSLAKQSDCLPPDYGYIPIFNKNQTCDFDPEDSQVECKPVLNNVMKIEPKLIEHKGLALSFWVYENLKQLEKTPAQTLEIFNGVLNNTILSTFKIFKDPNPPENTTTSSITLLHQFTFLNETATIKTTPKCAQHFFVLMSFQRDVDQYKAIASLRFPGSNQRQYFETKLARDEVEGLTVIFNTQNIFNTVSKIEYHKNFVYSEPDELKIMLDSKKDNIYDDTLTQGNVVIPTDALCQCRVSPICSYSTINDPNYCDVCETGYVNWNKKCVDKCPDGTFMSKKENEDKFECLPCSQNCEKCTSKDTCSQCTPTKNLLQFEGKCLDKCPDNAIKKVITVDINKNFTTCEVCDPNCLLCPSEKDGCIVCKGEFFTHEGKCVKDCPDGFFKDELRKSCVKCDPTCKLCANDINANQEKCNQCKEGYYLYNGRCHDSCGNGFFMNNATQTCDPCINNCKNCPVNPTNCTVCEEGFGLTPNVGENKFYCVSKCPTGHVMVNSVCLPCQVNNCVDCLKTDLKVCTKCDDNTVLKENNCATGCGTGNYYDTKLKKCAKCNNDCEICTESNKCLNCKAPKLLLNDNTCVDVCPTGYVKFGSVCVPCQNIEKCKQCSSQNTKVCVECYPVQFLHEGICIDKCPEKSVVGIDGKCVPCITGCDKCENIYSCNKCNDNFHIKNDICVTDCASGYVLNQKNNECLKCGDPQCDVCNENNPNICKKCVEGSLLYQLKCLEKCPAGTFPNSKNECEDCKPGCVDCTNKLDCKKCEAEKFVQNDKCVDRCDEGSTNLIKTSVDCKKCVDPNCKICDSSVSKCDQCKVGLATFQGQCVTTCPDGNYFDLTQNKCIQCDPICKKCLGSSSKCTDCQTGYSLVDFKCVDPCPDYSVADTVDKSKCHSCTMKMSSTPITNLNDASKSIDQSCKKCSSLNLNECVSCPQGLKYNTETKACNLACPQGFFESMSKDKCEKCVENCKICENKTGTCTLCEKGSVLFGKECVKKCPEGFVDYDNLYNFAPTCVACNIENCATCDKYNLKNCFVCQKPYSLLKNYCVPFCPQGHFSNPSGVCEPCSVLNCDKCLITDTNTCIKCQEGYFLKDNTCVFKCPEGFKSNQLSRKCEKCEVKDCTNCQNDKNTCTKCAEGLFYDKVANKCVKDCPLEMFSNNEKQTCEKCSKDCLICSSENKCLKCDSSTVLFEGRCIRQCPSGTFKNPETESCQKCDDPNCLKCLTKDKCVTCKSPNVLNNSTCVENCPNKTYLNTYTQECRSCLPDCDKCSTFNKCENCTSPLILQKTGKCGDNCPAFSITVNTTCIPCKTTDVNCVKCDSKDLTLCKECSFPKVLVNNVCLDNCPEGTFLEMGKCKPCDTGCKKCRSEIDCYECKTDNFLINNKCVTDCPPATFKQNGQCLPCSVNCKECLDDKNCKVCPTGMVIMNGECKPNCDNKYYLDTSLNKCIPCSTGCLQCSNKDNCEKCEVALTNSKGACIKECVNGTVQVESECQPCKTGCLTCKPENKECTKCEIPKVILNGECVTECPVANGYYLNTTEKACKKCEPIGDCIECTNNRNCTKCANNKVLSPFNTTSCIENCPLNFTKVGEKCANCTTANCTVCVENKPETCTECKYPLVLANNTCVTSCPTGTYLDKNGTCIKCEQFCKVCSSQNVCNECDAGLALTLVPDLNKFKCISPCGVGQVRNSTGNCVPCNTTDCLVCKTNPKCEECKSPLLLVTVDNSTKCLENCPKGNYIDNLTKKCLLCSKNCTECEAGNVCKTCEPGFILFEGACVNRCPDKFVERNLKCVPCENPKCKECDPVNPAICTKCEEKLYLKDSTCVEMCDLGFFILDLENGCKKCHKCIDSCEVCQGAANCNKCVAPMVLKDSKCIKVCPDGSVEVNGVCKTCVDENCKKCDPNNQASCSECKLPNVLYKDKCVSNCPEGFTLSFDNQCNKCVDDACLKCGPTTVCKECKLPQLLLNSKCVDNCPEGFVAVNGKCEECLPENCGKCSPQDLSKCVKCAKGSLVTNIAGKTACVDPCPEGTSQDNVLKTCTNCTDPYCKKCSLNENICDKCQDNYILNKNATGAKCIDPCPAGSVSKILTKANSNETSTQCVQCNTTSVINCIKCDLNDTTKCSECSAGLVLLNNTCYVVCPDGSYQLNRAKCAPCDDKCGSCSATPLNCTKCILPFIQDPQSNSCVEKCADGSVKLNNTCIKCNTDIKTCKECSPQNLNECKNCKGGLELFNGTCVEICPTGTLLNPTNNTCSNCTQNCQICQIDNTNTLKCTTCENGFKLLDGKCVKDCPQGTFLNFTDCSKCNTPDCSKCPDKGACVQCVAPKILLNGQCVDKCTTDTTQVNSTCLACTVECDKCGGLNKCNVCKLPLSPMPDGKCGYPACKEGFIQRDVCVACKDDNCRICDPANLNQCKDCKSGLLLLDAQCVEKCPTAFFASTVDKTCKPCSDNCAACSNSTSCDKCVPNFTKLDNLCVNCDNNKFVVVGDKCTPCNVTSCDKCQPGQPNKCEQCRPDKSLTPNPENKCADICPVGTFRNETTHTCESCKPDCIVCTTPTAKCEVCKTPLINLNGACVNDCPNGYTKSIDPTTDSAKCRKCRDDHCQICDALKPEICLKCDNVTSLFNEECKSICPKGFYLQNQTCTNCTQFCDVCEVVKSLVPGEPETKLICKKCDLEHKLQDGVCVKECKVGFYETSDSVCVPCKDPNCIQCNPADVCRKCNTTTFLDKPSSTCVTYCPDGTYKNTTTNECDTCKENCKLCKDDKTCFMCKEGFKSNNASCVSTCPIKMTDVNGACIPCSQDKCLNCEANRPDKCTKCNTTAFLANGICVDACPPGTYANATTNKCEPCNVRSVECNSATNSTKCKSEFYLRDGKCISKCEKGKVEIDGKCACCTDNNCKTCLKDQKVCLKCLDGFFLFENSCVRVCPMGNFKNDKNECQKCSMDCELCLNADRCSKCYSKTFLNDKGLCLKECETGSFGDCVSGHCVKCHESCEKCIDNTNANCPLCAKGFYKSDANCVTQPNCKYGTFADDTSRECVSCKIPNCDVCKDRNTCNTCLKGYTLSSDLTVCSEFKSIVNVIKSPLIFSEPTHEKFNTYNGYSFSSQLKSSCVDSNFFTLSFWLRLITPDLSSNPILIEIKDTILNIGTNINFRLQNIENDRLKCQAQIKHGNSSVFEISYDDCSFLKLQKWTFFAININKEKEINSVGLGSNVNFIMYELSSNKTYYVNRNFTEKIYNKSSVIISNSSSLYINPDYQTSPAFEVANMNIMEYIPQVKDIEMLTLGDKPSDCDYNCADCTANKCLKCNNAPLPNSDGFCPGSFVSISAGLMHLEVKTLTEDLRSYLSTNYISSERYSFVSFIYIENFNNNTELATTLNLISLDYKQNNIIKAELVKDILQVRAGNLPLAIYPNIFVYSKNWYAISLSVSPQIISVILYDVTHKMTLIRDEKVVSIDKYTLRLLPDAKLTLGQNFPSKTGSYSQLTVFDARLYINNMISEKDINDHLLKFKCSDKCLQCDQNMNCAACVTGYEVNALSNTCEPKTIGKPSAVYLRKSIYNYEVDIIDSPFNFIDGSFTLSIWLRKNLPSAYGVKSGTSTAPLITNIISFYDKSTNKLLPFFQQEIKEGLTSRYIIDNANLLSPSPSTRKVFNKDKTYFNDYVNRMESSAESKTKTAAVFNQLVEFSANYRNSTADWINVVLTSKSDGASNRKFTVYINDKAVNNSIYSFTFDVHPQLQLNNSVILGDSQAAQVNMMHGPDALYRGETFDKAQVTLIGQSPPKDCDSSCIDCNSLTGYCRLCGVDKLQGDTCNPFYYGFKKSGIYDHKQYESVKQLAQSTGFHEDYNVALYNIFKRNIDASTYSVMGWFQLFSLIDNTAGESILFRLSNVDSPTLKEDDPFYFYYPGVNLITMKIIYSLDADPKYAFVISDFDKDKIIPVKGLKVRPNEWNLVYAFKSVKERLFGYKIYCHSEKKLYELNYTLEYMPQKLQEIATLKLSGINSITNKNSLETYAFFFNFYLVPNMGLDSTAIDNYRAHYDPTVINATTCDSKCSKCIIDTCFQCQEGYILNNNNCVLENLMVKYLLLTDQNSVQSQYSKVYFPPTVITDSYGFQFNIRRNYQNLKSVYLDAKSRVFLELGALKFALITSNTDAFIKIYSSSDPAYSISVGPLDANFASDYNWHTVVLNFDANKNSIECLLLNGQSQMVEKKTLTYNLIKTSYDNVIINNLNYEVTTFGALYILNYNKMSTALLPLPQIDCPIDCTFCQNNNQCKLCTYGKECDLNDPNYDACKLRWKSLYSFDVNSSQHNKNVIALKDVFTTNKLIRFKQFSFIFSFQLKEENKYSTIFRIINNADTSLTNIDATSINYNILSLSYNSETKRFSLSYHNRQTDLKFQSPVTSLIKSYPSTNFLNENHFAGLSYNSEEKKLIVVLYNSEENYVTDEIPLAGEFENLGLYTNFIFFEDFLKLNSNTPTASTSVTNLKFLYETSTPSKNLFNKIRSYYKTDIAVACYKTDPETALCKQCLDKKVLVKGVCLSENLSGLPATTPFVFYPNSPIVSFKMGDNKPLLMSGFTADTKSFTLQFSYRRLSYPEGHVNAIMALSLFNANKVAEKNLYELYEIDNNLVGIARGFSQPLITFVLDFIEAKAKFPWIHITVQVDLEKKTNSIYVFNYLNNKSFTKMMTATGAAPSPIQIPKDYSLGINYDLATVKVTIPSGILSVASVSETSPNLNTEFNIANLIFTPNYLYSDPEIVSLRPKMPVKCSCACGCVNGVCPEHCRLDNVFVDLANNPNSNGLLLNKIANNIKSALSLNNLNNEVTNNNMNSEESMKATALAADYHKLAVSFTVNVNNYLSFMNNANGATNTQAAKTRKGFITSAERQARKHEIQFASREEPALKSDSAVKVVPTSSTTNADSRVNSDILFLLTNQFDTASSMQASSKISEDLVKLSMLTLRVVNNKIRAYIGSDRFTDYLSYTEIDLNISEVERIVFFLYVDIHENTSKFILFADNKRIDHVFNYNFAIENININSLFYINGLLLNPVINFSDNLDNNLFYLKSAVDANRIKDNLCPATCKTCFEGRCLECAVKKRMYNNSCIDVTNSKDYSNVSRKKRALNDKSRNSVNKNRQITNLIKGNLNK